MSHQVVVEFGYQNGLLLENIEKATALLEFLANARQVKVDYNGHITPIEKQDEIKVRFVPKLAPAEEQDQLAKLVHELNAKVDAQQLKTWQAENKASKLAKQLERLGIEPEVK